MTRQALGRRAITTIVNAVVFTGVITAGMVLLLGAPLNRLWVIAFFVADLLHQWRTLEKH